MAAPVTLLQTSDGDLDMSKGLRLTESVAQFVAQRVRSRLRFFLGEWFLDTRLGVPYFTRVFVSNPDVSLISSLLRRVAAGTPGVASVDVWAARFERGTRKLRVTAKLRASDGATVAIDTLLLVPLGAST